MIKRYRFCKSPINFLADMSEDDLIQGFVNVSVKKGALYLSIDIYSNNPLLRDMMRVSGMGFDKLVITSEKMSENEYRSTYTTRQTKSTGMITLALSHPNALENMTITWHEGTITDPHGHSGTIIGDQIIENITEEEISRYETLRELFAKLSSTEKNQDIVERISENLKEIQEIEDASSH